MTENRQNKQELFQIGEVCKTMGLSRRILLNYEELGLLTPAMRREDKGFRYYSADNLAHIRVIRNLQELGLSLSAIRSYFGDTGQLEDQIQRLVDLRNRLDQYIAQLRMRQGEATDPEVCMVTLPAFTAYCRDFSGADLQEKTSLLRQTYIDAAHSYSLDFHSRMCTQLFIRNPDSGTFIIPVSPESQGPCIRKFDQTSALSLFFRGAYEEFPPLHARLLAYAEAHGMTPHGYFRNIYIEGPPHPRLQQDRLRLPADSAHQVHGRISARKCRKKAPPLAALLPSLPLSPAKNAKTRRPLGRRVCIAAA